MTPPPSTIRCGESVQTTLSRPSARYSASSCQTRSSVSSSGGLPERCSYVKAGLAFSVLKTTRTSSRFRQRIASRRLLPSACLRSR